MKIIKHGTTYATRNKEYKFICNSCTCEWVMTARELQEDQQSLVYTATCRCPECQSDDTRSVEVTHV